MCLFLPAAIGIGAIGAHSGRLLSVNGCLNPVAARNARNPLALDSDLITIRDGGEF